jgi:DICT domain-containing protein
MISKPLVAIVFAGLFLSACSARYQTPTAMGGDDDDAVCQGRGLAVGSPEYVACRKDRDVQRSAATSRADRRQRDLGEYMLNHPDRP